MQYDQFSLMQELGSYSANFTCSIPQAVVRFQAAKKKQGCSEVVSHKHAVRIRGFHLRVNAELPTC